MANKSKPKAEVQAQTLTRAVMYCRVSDQDQVESDLSISAQKKALRKWAEAHDHLVVREYVEPGVSARDENRPEFRRMIGELLDGTTEATTILVAHTSRFMRNTEASLLYRKRLERQGIKVVSTTQPINDGPAGKLMEVIFAAFDQYESDMNAYRTMAAMRENAERGFFNGSKAPFGFQVIKVIDQKAERGKLVPLADEAPIVRHVFALCIEGLGAKATAAELSKRGINYRGRSWSKDDVLRVLDEEAAIGTYYWGKWDTMGKTKRPREDWVPIPVEPIIERDLFDNAHELRRQRGPETRPGRGSPLLLAKLVKCGKCGAAYSKESSGKKFAGEFPHAYYNCSKFLRLRKGSCRGKRLRVNVLDRLVLDHLSDKLFTAARCRALAQDLIERSGLLRQRVDDRRVQLRALIDKTTKSISKWEAAYEDGRDLDVVAPRLRELRAERENLQHDLGNLQPLAPAPKNLLTDETIQKFQDKLRDIFISNDTPMTKNYLRFLVEEIVVFDDRVVIKAKARNAVVMMAHPEPLAMGGANHPDPVLTKGGDWLRLLDSNPQEVPQSRELTDDSRKDEPTRVDASARELVAIGPEETYAPEDHPVSVEAALAIALLRASAAKEWALVAQLARELEARRAP
jgi:site-specific DNA recombinase